ncbi:MAG: hypothetical protein NTX61_08930 [Bacteroidetes bacterium]|nr:hypothetical protein [Bacteroidota bacterium]
MKRIIFTLSTVILLLIFNLFPFTTVAQEDQVYIFVVSQSGLVPDQNVSISLLMNNEFLIQNGSLFLYYDADILTPISPYYSNVAPGANLTALPIGPTAGKYSAIEIDIESDTSSGADTYKLCDLTFQFHGGNTALLWDIDSSFIFDLNGNYSYIEFTIGNAGGQYRQVTSAKAGQWNTASTWNPEIIPNRSADAIIANMPVTVPDSTDQRCHNLTISHAGGLTLNQESTLSVGGNFIIESDSSGTGSLLDNGTLSIADSTMVKRFLTGDLGTTDKKNHFLSSPVQSQNIQPEFVSDPPDTTAVFSKFDEPSATWISAITSSGEWNTSFENQFMDGKGYLVAVPASTSKIFRGSLNKGSFTLPCSYTAAPGASGWNLLGNPYPSSLNWNSVKRTAGIDNALYYYDAGIQNYRYYIQLPGDTMGVGSATPYIPPMQGFMIHAEPGGGSVTFEDSQRVHPISGIYYKYKDPIPEMLELDLEGNNFTDQTFIIFLDGSTENFDPDREALKLYSFNPQVPVLLTLTTDSTELAINALPHSSAPVVVKMHFETSVEGTFTLTAKFAESFGSQTAIGLEDLKINQTQDLKVNPVYTFTANQGDDPERFHLHFSGVNGIKDQGKQGQVIIYSYGENVYIEGLNETRGGELIIYNLLGQEIRHQLLPGNDLIRVPMAGYSGYFLVKVVTGIYCKTDKVYLK